MADNALLFKTYNHIAVNEHTWDQATWRDCFAGHAVRLSGLEFLTDENSTFGDSVIVDSVIVDEEHADYHLRYDGNDWWYTNDGDGTPVQDVCKVAPHVLDITTDQANKLFRCDNTMADIRAQVQEMTGAQVDAATGLFPV